MSAAAFHDGMTALLATDATFTAAIAALLGMPVTGVLQSNVPLANIPTGSLPCWVLEQGDGQAQSLNNEGADEGLVIGHSQQQFASELHVSLVWNQNDRDTAGAQRRDLPTLLAQLMLRHPQPGGIEFALLREWQPDAGVNHPLQVWRATLVGEYTIHRDQP